MGKILIIGDMHLGVKNNSPKYLEFQKKWVYDTLIPSIKKISPVAIFIVGDVFDNRTAISPVIIKESISIFKDILNLTKVHILLGNHDIFFKNSREVHSLEVLKEIGCTIYDNPTELTLSNKKLFILPWLLKTDKEDIKVKLATNHYDLCLGHLEINGFEMMKGIVDNTGLSSELFANCEIVESGHYHIRNRIKNIQYVGSPYELDYGDLGTDKGIDVIDLNTMEKEFIRSKNIPLHKKLRTKTTSLEDIDSDLITNNFISLKLDNDLKEVDKINYIEKINSLNPIIFSVDNEEIFLDDGGIEVATSIKDTVGFFSEYIDLIEIPEGLDKKILLQKIEEIYKRVN